MKDVTYNGDGVLYEGGLRLESGRTYRVTNEEAAPLEALKDVDLSIKDAKKGSKGISARETVGEDAESDTGGPGGSGPAEGETDTTTTAP